MKESSTDFCGLRIVDLSGRIRFVRIHLSTRTALAQSVSQSVQADVVNLLISLACPSTWHSSHKPSERRTRSLCYATKNAGVLKSYLHMP